MTSDEFGDIEQLDENLRKWFKEKWVRFGPDGKIRGACARGDDSEGKPKCLPQKKAQNLGKKGRKYAASKKRREDPNPERRGKAKNVATKKKTNEDVPFNECPQCRGPIVHESMMTEKQDACYHKVKSRYKVWPSAYASGALVQCRKKGASNWGTGGKKKNESSIMKGIVDESENVLVLYIDGKPSAKYAIGHEAKTAMERLQAKFPNKKLELKREMREASGTPGGLEMFRTKGMVDLAMQQNLYKKDLEALKKAQQADKPSPSRSTPSVAGQDLTVHLGSNAYPTEVVRDWIANRDIDSATEFMARRNTSRQSKEFKAELIKDPRFAEAVANFFDVAAKTLQFRDKMRSNPRLSYKDKEEGLRLDGFDATRKINSVVTDYLKKFGVDKTGRRVPPTYNYDLGEAKAKQYVKPYNNPQTGEQMGWVSSDGYHKKYWQMFAKDSAIKHAKLNPDEVDEAVDPNLGYDPNDYDDDYEEPPLQTATHVTIDDISMQRGGDLPAGTELKQHKRSSDPGPDNRARFWFFVVLDNGYPTRLVRLPKKMVKPITVQEDYTGEFAAEVTPAINPYGGLKDKQFRGAISEEPTTSGPIGTQPGGWRKYKPKPAGEIEEDTSYAGGMGQGGNAGQSYRKFKPKSAGTFKEEQLDEKCWDTHKQIGMKTKGGKSVPNCVPKESAIMKGINRLT